MDTGDMGGDGEGSLLGRRDELVEELCRAHEPQLLVYLTRMLGRADVAREVIQDTYERIHKLYRPEDVMFPRAMLYKIATNFALMRLRRARLESKIITGSQGMEKVPDEAASPCGIYFIAGGGGVCIRRASQAVGTSKWIRATWVVSGKAQYWDGAMNWSRSSVVLTSRSSWCT